MTAAILSGIFYSILVTDLKTAALEKGLIMLIAICAVFLLIKLLSRWLKPVPKTALLWIPFVVMTVTYVQFNFDYWRAVREEKGFWMLRAQWDDMQNFVRDNTPKDAVLLVPQDMKMGGFRIFSERSIVVSERDCGIIGFDYNAAKEWQQRMSDMQEFKVISLKPKTTAILSAITEYHATHVVFMNYYTPAADQPLLKEVYRNAYFSLFAVAPEVSDKLQKS